MRVSTEGIKRFLLSFKNKDSICRICGQHESRDTLVVNTLRRYISEALYSFPRTRFFVKRAYKVTMFCIGKIIRLFKPIEPNLLQSETVTDSKYHCFFGYYDKCPWDSSGDYLLYHKVPLANRMPKPGETAEICLYDVKKSKTTKIAETKAWCWQQGCRLQWLPCDGELLIIYNDFQHGKYVSIIRSLEGKARSTLPLPIHAVSKDGKQAISVDFSRLAYTRPGYGYVAKQFSDMDNLHPEDNGIWHMNLKTGEYKLIISLDQITNVSWQTNFKEAFHYFDQVEFNPTGSRIVFLHRWFKTGRKKSIRGPFSSRMFTASSEGNEVHLLVNHGMVSHFTWKDDRHLLVWATHPIGGRRYYLFEDHTKNVKVVGDGILTEDGHPSYSADRRWILTDTYPDADRMRILILFDTKTSKRYDIGRYFAPFRFDGPLRCDLHPRWSPDGKRVCFDSVHEGRRGMYVVDVSELLE